MDNAIMMRMWKAVLFVIGIDIAVHGAVLWECDNFPANAPADGCDWNRFDFSWGEENTAGVPDPAGRPGNAMSVFYKNGSWVTNEDNKGGARFRARPFSPADELTLEYELYFSPNFDFVLGGKLPGLYGGTGGSCSGGDNEENCFSARYMWRADGDGEVYCYIPNEKDDWFCDNPDVHCDFDYGHSFGRGTWRMIPGRWYSLAQTIKLNSVGATDGAITVHVDGSEVYHISGLTFRIANNMQIDTILFATFFGGNDATWQSSDDVYTYYRNFKVID